MKKLFELAEELYWEELKKSGMSVIPYAWAKKDSNFLAISCFGKCSDQVEDKLKEII
jgi:hypothetical protein